jgi:phytoene/squalene synthetase
MDNNLKQALDACEQMISQGSTTFYKAFGFLPSPRKEAVYVIYAFCRMIDNAVDEPDQSPYSLDELEQSFRQLEKAEAHFIWPALRWLFASFKMSTGPFFRQMEGQRLDYRLLRYESMEQLERYSYLVAGTVGEMLLPVLHDAPDEQVTLSGSWLGKAMQIVNIVRDVGEDKAKGRRYVPLELMHKHGYTEAMWERGEVNAEWRSLMGELAGLARRWFARGLSDLEQYPRTSGFCVELAARMYEAILDDAALNHYDVYSRRSCVSAVSKISIINRLALRHGMGAVLAKGAMGSAVS